MLLCVRARFYLFWLLCSVVRFGSAAGTAPWLGGAAVRDYPPVPFHSDTTFTRPLLCFSESVKVRESTQLQCLPKAERYRVTRSSKVKLACCYFNNNASALAS